MLTVQSHSPGMSATQAALQAFNEQATSRKWPFRCAPAGNFRQPELNSVLTLWLEKARGKAMPARADMTARAMKSVMTHMSLLERIATDTGPRYRVRLHGSALARYDGDNTGKFLEDVVHADRIDSYRGLYDTMLAVCAPLRVVSFYQAPELDYLTGESLIAPLSAPCTDTPIVLSVTYAKPRSESDAGSMHALLQRNG